MSSLWSHNLVSRWRRSGTQETVYRQLLALLQAGVPLPTAFVQLRTFAPTSAAAQTFSEVARSVARGETLGGALVGHDDLFDPAHVALLSAGEASGSLEVVLKQLIGHLEAMRQLRWKTVVASLWPAYLIAALVFVAPLMRVSSQVKTLDDVGPAYLRGVVPGLLALVLGLLGVVLGPVLVAALKAELAWDRLLLSLPVIGTAVTSFASARALGTLGLGLGAGLDVERSLRAAVSAAGRPSLAPRADSGITRLRQGSTLFDALSVLGLFDRATLGQVGIAEQTGTLHETLVRLSHDVQERGVRALRTAMLVLVGVVTVFALVAIVGSLLRSIFGPLKGYYDAIGNGL